jgi:hypothetical protein
MVQDEISLAPVHVRELFVEMALRAEFADLTPEAQQLQEAYMLNRIVPPRYEADALHVALATVEQCWAIVSWNFRHIVQLDKIRQYNAVNRLLV